MKTLLILAVMTISLFGFAGGGGSSSGGGGSSSSSSSHSSSHSSRSSDGDSEMSVPQFLAFLAVFGIFFAAIVFYGKYVDRKKQQALEARDQNSSEQEKWIHDEAARIFAKYQEDWSNFNLEGIKKYTTDSYFEHASLMLTAIKQMNRRNVISNLVVSRTFLFSPVNNETSLPAKIQVMFQFNGTDGLETLDSKQLISSNNAQNVVEYWNFIYDGKSLKLDGITQSTESTPHLITSIADFARSNNLFYSPDWGRLALPTQGLIFNRPNLLTSADVNNHVIGKWKDCLVQIYTFSATPGAPNSYYIVGQINVPKSYEGVIVESKKANLKVAKPKDYNKFDLEWGEFNDRYNVFASSRDALPAFELLNPAFMEKMYERNLPYNLEVKDNVIYVFARVTKAREEDYAELLNVLSEAFNELKM